MKNTAAIITYAAALLLAPQFAMAQRQPSPETGTCYNVANPDTRAYCLARAHRDPGRCYNIQSGDLRSVCLAEVRR